MTDPDPHAVIICFTGSASETGIEGAVDMTCDECGCPIAVAPSSMKIYQRHETAELLCGECGEKRAGNENAEVQMLSPEQFAELSKEFTKKMWR